MKHYKTQWLRLFAIAGLTLTLTVGCDKDGVELPELTTAEISEITAHSALTGGEIIDNGGGEIFSRGVVWDTIPEPIVEQYLGLTDEGAGEGAFESELTNLSRNTRYYVRAYAFNSEGVGYGPALELHTLGEYALVATEEIVEVTAVSAISGGEVTDDGGKAVTARGLVWSRQQQPTLENNDGNTVDGEGVGVFSSTMTGLDPSETYYVRAYATNEEGTAYGMELMFETEGILPTVTTAEILDTSIIAAFGGGSVSEEGSASVTAYGVIWSLEEEPDMENYEGKTVDGVGDGAFGSELVALFPNTSYYARAYATNAVGTAYGEINFFTTPPIIKGSVDDASGNSYVTILLNGQEWMAENLKTVRYNNGDSLNYHAHNDHAWRTTQEGAFAWYEHDENSHKDIFGALYNWHAVHDDRGLCPVGWRVPDEADWNKLAEFLEHFDGLANYLKSCRQAGSPLGGDCATEVYPRWDAHEEHYGLDPFGFAALPGGFRAPFGRFYYAGSNGFWWTSSTPAKVRQIDYDSGELKVKEYSKEYGFSVRCMR